MKATQATLLLDELESAEALDEAARRQRPVSRSCTSSLTHPDVSLPREAPDLRSDSQFIVHPLTMELMPLLLPEPITKRRQRETPKADIAAFSPTVFYMME